MKIEYSNGLYIEGEPGDEFTFFDNTGEHRLQVQSSEEAGCDQCYFRGLGVCAPIICDGLTYVEISPEKSSQSPQKMVVKKKKHR